jgi:hypothetical protein
LDDVAEVIYSIDTEFFFMAKGGTHATNQRISIGGKVVFKMKDGSTRMLSSLLEGDYHVIMRDAMTQARAKDLTLREKKSASWSKTINLHPENNEVLRMSEAEAITDFVGWLRELKDRLSNAKHVLRGHYATTVDFPALAFLALHRCDYDLHIEFVWEDSKRTLPAAHSGITVVPSRTSLPSRVRSPGLEAPSQSSLRMSAITNSHTGVPLSMRFARWCYA